MLLVWGVTAVMALVGIAYSIRIMKRGLSTLEDAKKNYYAKIEAERRKVEDEAKDITAQEQVHLLQAAVLDLLRLDDNPAGYTITSEQQSIILNTPKGSWKLSFSERMHTLHSTHRVLHGHVRWVMEKDGKEEHFKDIACMMASLNKQIHDQEE